jgi:hypothetical protein
VLVKQIYKYSYLTILVRSGLRALLHAAYLREREAGHLRFDPVDRSSSRRVVSAFTESADAEEEGRTWLLDG